MGRKKWLVKPWKKTKTINIFFILVFTQMVAHGRGTSTHPVAFWHQAFLSSQHLQTQPLPPFPLLDPSSLTFQIYLLLFLLFLCAPSHVHLFNDLTLSNSLFLSHSSELFIVPSYTENNMLSLRARSKFMGQRICLSQTGQESNGSLSSQLS